MKRLGLLVVVVGFCLTALARADEGEGRRRWTHGKELYSQGRYLEAAHEFEAGYAAAPRPLFLLNIGHAYRRAQELSKAKTVYQKLLRLQPDFPQRAEVEGFIKSIDDALQAGDTAEPNGPKKPGPGSPPATPPPALVDPSTPLPAKPMPQSLLAAPEEPPQSVPSLVGTTGTEASSPSVFRSPWFWVVLGAVVAGGVTAVVIATRPSSAACPSDICLKEMP